MSTPRARAVVRAAEAAQRTPTASQALIRNRAAATAAETHSALTGTGVHDEALAKQVHTDATGKKLLQDGVSNVEKAGTGSVVPDAAKNIIDRAPLPEMLSLISDRQKLADPESCSAAAADLSFDHELRAQDLALQLATNALAGAHPPSKGYMRGFLTQLLGQLHPKVQARAIVARARLTKLCAEHGGFVIDTADTGAQLILAPTTSVGVDGTGAVRPTQSATQRASVGRAQPAQATDHIVGRARATTSAENAELSNRGLRVHGVLELREGALAVEYKAGGKAEDGFVQLLDLARRSRFTLATLVQPDGSVTTWLIDYRPELVTHVVVAAIGEGAPSVTRSLATAKAAGIDAELVSLTPGFRRDVSTLADAILSDPSCLQGSAPNKAPSE